MIAPLIALLIALLIERWRLRCFRLEMFEIVRWVARWSAPGCWRHCCVLARHCRLLLQKRLTTAAPILW